MASQPSLRIGDAERESVAAELREHYAHGRLTLDELNQRLDAAFAAKTQQDLSQITKDLPHVRPNDVPLPSAQVGHPSGRVSSARSASGSWDHDWRERRHHGAGFATLATLLAALLSWLLVYDVFLVGLRWPLGGRIGLLVAVFAVIRGLLRRIFGVRRRGGCAKRLW
ncbi:MAG TPA: DUF1707 domain-containing protein [Streptosporangiaceae bacterium]|nr:DUF1707 domain-containing protein [Streptosporangiaceae bacterium]